MVLGGTANYVILKSLYRNSKWLEFCFHGRFPGKTSVLVLCAACTDFKSNIFSNHEFSYHNVGNYKCMIFQLGSERTVFEPTN